MRTPLMHPKSSTTRTRESSTVSTRKYDDTTSDSAHHSGSDRDSRPSGASSPENFPGESDTPRLNKVRQPISEAVTSGLNKATDTAHATITPEVIHAITSQITANVIQQLQTKNISVPPVAPSDHNDPPFASEDIFRDRVVYTPPSPDRSATSLTQSQTSPTFSQFSMASVNSQQSTSPTKERRPSSPLSSGSGHDDSDDSKRFTRPEAPKRMSTFGDATVMERQWGKLYDKDGQPTEKLGQFLRGIAVHIIEDYEPKSSLVVTPDKMQRYYEETKVPNEIYPWRVIFDDHESRISRMLRDLDVPHHLIQEEGRHNERPDIPGLTPRGFETWFKLVLKAQPDLEYERLAKTALHMPISNPDDKKEKKDRFPKELSKRLFIIAADPTTAARIEKAMSTHCSVTIPPRRDSILDADSRTQVPSHRKSEISPPPANNLQRPETGSSGISRHMSRSTTMGTSPLQGSAIQDDFDEGGPARPIERTRKPYVAHPGTGRQYEGVEITPASRTLSNIDTSSLPQPSLGRLGRSPSVTSAGGTGTRSRTLPIVHQPSNQQRDSSEARDSRYHPGGRGGRDHDRDRDRSTSASRKYGYGHRSEPHIRPGSYEPEPSINTLCSTQAHDRQSRRSFSNDGAKDRGTRERDRGERDRSEREPRSRKQSMNGSDMPKYHRNQAEEDFYSQNYGSGSISGGHTQFPPTAFRTKG